MEQNNNLALASMILGIVSIVVCCCCFGGVILGSLAVILACLSRVETSFTGQAKAGLITGMIGICLGFLSFAAWMFFVAAG